METWGSNQSWWPSKRLRRAQLKQLCRTLGKAPTSHRVTLNGIRCGSVYKASTKPSRGAKNLLLDLGPDRCRLLRRRSVYTYAPFSSCAMEASTLDLSGRYLKTGQTLSRRR